MTEAGGGRRHSKALSANLITDPVEKAERETLNALRQFDVAVEAIRHHTENGRPFRLRPSLILQLHRTALDGLSAYAGNYRPAGVEIEGSTHEPVGAHVVPERVEELCDYVNDNWETSTPIHLAAFIMWRLNWIHPFDDGNGRTSRILSFVVLCIKLGYLLPGANTIPDQIVANRIPYFESLEAADAEFKGGKIDVGKMEQLLSNQLAAQLYTIVKDAGGDHETN